MALALALGSFAAAAALAPAPLGTNPPAEPGSAPAPVARATAFVTDNAFRRGGVDRPVVRLRPGGTMTWTWASQESHQVTVRGPGGLRLRSATKSDGRFARRLTRPGTYRVVCSIHAPGMRMTIRVVR